MLALESGSGFLCCKPLVLGHQLVAAFAPGGIEGDAADGAYLLALRFIEMAHALGAFIGIDFVDFRAHIDCVIRALGLADVAVDAFVGD